MFGLVVLATLGGCGGDSTPNTSSPPGPSIKPVFMQGQEFIPSNLTVKAGDTVVWTNLNTGEHTTTSGLYPTFDGGWDSGLITENETHSVTFDIAGSYVYFCRVHGDKGMIGSVTVQP